MLVNNIRQSYTPCNLSKQENGLKVRPGHEEDCVTAIWKGLVASTVQCIHL